MLTMYLLLSICDKDDAYDSNIGLTSIFFLEENVVRELSHKFFQSKLIKHFNIYFQRNEIVWPKRKLEGGTIVNNNTTISNICIFLCDHFRPLCLLSQVNNWEGINLGSLL